MPLARETRYESAVLDGFAECMGHEYRRKVLFSLHRSDETPIAVPDDLLDGAVDRDRLTVELVHNHLPRLKDRGYVSWDRDAGTVERGEGFEQLVPLLDVLTAHYDHIVPGPDRNRPE